MYASYFLFLKISVLVIIVHALAIRWEIQIVALEYIKIFVHSNSVSKKCWEVLFKYYLMNYVESD
jgi:hypothetical protein